jgi:DNA-binding IclR family transcriptional regulator
MSARSSPINAVQKACRILRSLSNPDPARLTDVAASTSLNKATALRILDILAKEGFVQRIEQSKSWSLGTEMYVLGAAAARRQDVRERVRPAMVRLAAATHDTVLLSIRSGIESVCVDREIGDYPIRANYLDIGSRRPLGVGAGSMALLAWLPDAEIEAILPLVRPALGEYPKFSARFLEREIEQSRSRGYSLVLNQIVPRMGGIAVPVFGIDGNPTAALSVAALSERISPRIDELATILKKEAKLAGGVKGMSEGGKE